MQIGKGYSFLINMRAISLDGKEQAICKLRNFN